MCVYVQMCVHIEAVGQHQVSLLIKLGLLMNCKLYNLARIASQEVQESCLYPPLSQHGYFKHIPSLPAFYLDAGDPTLSSHPCGTSAALTKPFF